jgi:trimeric autotransporter adhesin
MAALGLLLVANWAAATPITRFARLTGNLNYVATGGTLRAADNNGDACALNASSSQALSGIPIGAGIVAAYLYWGASGATPDGSVTLNGAGVTASRIFTTTFTLGATNYPYFGGFADVTSQIGGNGTMTFAGLTIDNGNPYCASQAVVGGWSLIVVYSQASEPLRAINVFDGLDFFRGSALTLTPDGFRVPATGADGKMTAVTWEGDPGNSGALNGFSESLQYNALTLDDGINVAGSNPLVQPFDGTINTLGVATSWGVDVDTFDITAAMVPGATSGTTIYSAGNDLVLLTAQVISATSEPAVDLSITKTHTGTFVAGTNAVYTLHVANAPGMQRADFAVTVTDVLPAGLSFVSGTGTGWSCTAAGQTVTCTHAGPLDPGQAFADIALTVAVSGAALPSVSNTASVSSPSFDLVPANNTVTDTAAVVGPSLATSTKTVQDLNGGDANPGDTLRYTITLNESAGYAAPRLSVTDDVPLNVSSYTLVSYPAGATNASTGSGTGANGTGFINLSNIAVAANGSATVVFDVVVAAGTSAGALIANSATVTNPNGPGASPAAPTVVVSASQIPGSGSKPLYFYSTPGNQLSRTPPVAAQAAVTINGGASSTWTLTPVLQKAVTLQAGNIAVPLLLTRSAAGSATRTITVTLGRTGSGTPIATASLSSNTISTTTPGVLLFSLPLAAATTVPAGAAFTLTVSNTTGTASRTISVWPNSGGSLSSVQLNSATVINVDSVQPYNAAYPGGAPTASFAPGAVVYARAVVSDPFGSFDIAGAVITVRNPSGTALVSAAAMTQVADSGAATRTYEYAYTLPANAPAGGWTLSVTATEGTEGVVTHTANAGFTVVVPQPALTVQKTSEVLSDPVNNAVNPKRIPGSVQRYVITITNTGPGAADASSVVITDATPAGTVMYVSTALGNPVEFIDGATPSGLSFSYATSVSYSNQPGGGAPYNYAPTPDAAGYDAAVTGLRVAPSGTLNGAVGPAQPSFTVRFRVRVN